VRWLLSLFASSIGRKILIALAGLLLCLFLVSHLAGNLFLLMGEEVFNHYAKSLSENPLILPAEAVLLFLFLIHIAVSLAVRYQNRQARPVPYALQASKGGGTAGSRTMIYSGILLLVFLVVHIKTFKFGDMSRGLYQLVMASFRNGYYSLFYVLAMAGLCLHLSHGFQSAFQTLGIHHPAYTPWIKRAGLAFALAIALGFAFLPLWAYVKGLHP